jgi:hypothetical protein
MAQCAGCGTKVGCGCRLSNGLCATCKAKLEKQQGKK